MEPVIEILGLPLLACGAIAAILGYLGIHVLKREIIFIDITLAQIAAFGSVAAHLALKAPEDSLVAYLCSLGGVLLAAIFFSVVQKRIGQISLEVVIGVSYAIAAAAFIFLVGVAPGGHMHVQEILAGSILWTRWSDFLVCLLVFSAVGFIFYLLRKPMLRISDNYQEIAQAGIKVIGWDFLFYTLLGIVITLAVQIAGVVLVFSYLIIPATIAAIFSSRVGVQLVIAWVVGAAASVAGLLFAYYHDFSVGPAIGLALGVILIIAATGKKLIC